MNSLAAMLATPFPLPAAPPPARAATRPATGATMHVTMHAAGRMAAALLCLCGVHAGAQAPAQGPGAQGPGARAPARGPGAQLLAQGPGTQLPTQAAGYADADSMADAVGAMRITIESARVMREECIGRVAALQPEIDANFQRWRNLDGPLIRKAEQYWVELLRKQPGLNLQLAAVEPAVRRNLESIANPQPVAGSTNPPGTVMLSQYCRQHFTDLATGAWHLRTPRVYRYLDEAP